MWQGAQEIVHLRDIPSRCLLVSELDLGSCRPLGRIQKDQPGATIAWLGVRDGTGVGWKGGVGGEEAPRSQPTR